jgi:hypothetical protein
MTTLYKLIKQVSNLITPESNDFYNYVLYTSDDNDGFLRTRWCWFDKSIADKILHSEYKKVLVTCNKEISADDLVNKEDTNLKLQFHYDYLDPDFEDAEWDLYGGYEYIYLFNLDTNEVALEHRDTIT